MLRDEVRSREHPSAGARFGQWSGPSTPAVRLHPQHAPRLQFPARAGFGG